MRECRRFIGPGGSCIIGLGLRRRRVEQLARPRDVVGAGGAGEETVVADAVKAVGQDVDEEAADELVGGELHDLVAGAAVGPIVLVFESDAPAIESDQPAVGDGDAVSVARQIGQHRLRSAERGLGVDVPLDLAQRRQIGREGFAFGERGMS